MDGWFGGEGCNQPSCSFSAPHKRLPDLHQRPFCSVETGYVPGFSHKEGLDYLEVEEQQLRSSAPSTVNRQLYQTEMFMGCKKGEIEEVAMMSTASNINMQTGIRSMLTEEFVQQYSSPLGELFQPDQSRRSSSSSPLGELFQPDQSRRSSSSSLRSLSVGSPEYSPVMLSRASSGETSIEQLIAQPRSPQLVLPHQAPMQSYGQIRHVQFPTPTTDVDAAMTRAMLAVLSSSSPTSPHAQSHARCGGGAFQPYEPSPLPMVEAMQASQGQGMMKRAISMLRQIKSASPAEAPEQETRPSSNQLNHVMSERKRREKLNENFAELRASLPLGTKRDKASVLASTIDYVTTVKAEISTLEKKNQLMEARLLPADETDEEVDASPPRVRIKIDSSHESSSRLRQIELRVMARVEYCDMIELVLHILECLKQTRGVNLVSLDAGVHSRQMNPIRRAVLTMHVKGDDWDEDSFMGAIAKAVDEASRRPETAAP